MCRTAPPRPRHDSAETRRVPVPGARLPPPRGPRMWPTGLTSAKKPNDDQDESEHHRDGRGSAHECRAGSARSARRLRPWRPRGHESSHLTRDPQSPQDKEHADHHADPIDAHRPLLPPGGRHDPVIRTARMFNATGTNAHELAAARRSRRHALPRGHDTRPCCRSSSIRGRAGGARGTALQPSGTRRVSALLVPMHVADRRGHVRRHGDHEDGDGGGDRPPDPRGDDREPDQQPGTDRPREHSAGAPFGEPVGESHLDNIVPRQPRDCEHDADAR